MRVYGPPLAGEMGPIGPFGVRHEPRWMRRQASVWLASALCSTEAGVDQVQAAADILVDGARDRDGAGLGQRCVDRLTGLETPWLEVAMTWAAREAELVHAEPEARQAGQRWAAAKEAVRGIAGWPARTERAASIDQATDGLDWGWLDQAVEDGPWPRYPRKAMSAVLALLREPVRYEAAAQLASSTIEGAPPELRVLGAGPLLNQAMGRISEDWEDDEGLDLPEALQRAWLVVEPLRVLHLAQVSYNRPAADIVVRASLRDLSVLVGLIYEEELWELKPRDLGAWLNA